MTNEELIEYVNDTKAPIEVKVNNDTVWLTQKALAELFGVKVPAINKHLKNIFESKELSEHSVISILETTASDGKKYKTNFYNLDLIIAVGYRVNSYQATQFRIWATKILKDRLLEKHIIDSKSQITINIGQHGTFLLANNTIGNFDHSFNGFLEVLDEIKDPFIQKEAQKIRRYISENEPNKAIKIINNIKDKLIYIGGSKLADALIQQIINLLIK